MDKNLLITFILLNITNVVIQTVKSLVTVKGSKITAAFANAVAYGLYTIVTIYMLCDLPTMWKALIIAVCNFIGVYCVKWCEEKARKDKLWKVEATVKTKEEAKEIIALCKDVGIPCNYIDINRYVLVNCYCETQKQSIEIKSILDTYNAKYFVSESKTL